ncbi:MAG: alpha/beta hydrolase [Bacteriovoracaceae bacterium]
MKKELKVIQGIETIALESDSADTAVVFFHGYGANMHDLFPLWELWHRNRFNWYFPNGTESLPMGYYEGRAWFSIDIEGLERAIREGRQREMAGYIPPELETTLKRLETFLLDIMKKHKRLILGGFSQGAMCASHLAMKDSFAVDGLILLSGSLLAQEKFPKAAKGIPFFQAHGTQDPILDLEGARALEKKLQSMNFQGKLSEFRGGHEIPPQVVKEVGLFLEQFT